MYMYMYVYMTTGTLYASTTCSTEAHTVDMTGRRRPRLKELEVACGENRHVAGEL